MCVSRRALNWSSWSHGVVLVSCVCCGGCYQVRRRCSMPWYKLLLLHRLQVLHVCTAEMCCMSCKLRLFVARHHSAVCECIRIGWLQPSKTFLMALHDRHIGYIVNARVYTVVCKRKCTTNNRGRRSPTVKSTQTHQGPVCTDTTPQSSGRWGRCPSAQTRSTGPHQTHTPRR